MTAVQCHLLRDLGIALDDWIHQYAPEQCDEQYVRESVERVMAAGGTLAYIADLRQRIRKTLAASRRKG